MKSTVRFWLAADPRELQVKTVGGKKKRGTVRRFFSREKPETSYAMDSNGNAAGAAGGSHEAASPDIEDDESEYTNAAVSCIM